MPYYGQDRAKFETSQGRKTAADTYGVSQHSMTPYGQLSPVYGNQSKVTVRPAPSAPSSQPAPQTPQPPAGALSGPGAAEKYWQGVQGQFAGHNPTPNYSADFYNRHFGGPSTANLDPYYDKAHEIGSERLDRAMGARGLFGSSAAAEAQTDLASRLGAEQANREADHYARMMGLGTTSAGQATQSGLGLGGQQLSYLMGGGQLAGQAQVAERARWNDQAQNVLNGILAMMPGVQAGFGAMLQNDQTLLDLINQGDIATAQAYAEQKKQQHDTAKGTIGQAVNIGRSIWGQGQ